MVNKINGYLRIWTTNNGGAIARGPDTCLRHSICGTPHLGLLVGCIGTGKHSSKALPLSGGSHGQPVGEGAPVPVFHKLIDVGGMLILIEVAVQKVQVALEPFMALVIGQR